MERFAASRALVDGEHDFAEFLWDYGPEDPRWTLSIVETVLENPHTAERSLPAPAVSIS